jgi:hypothetical protein
MNRFPWTADDCLRFLRHISPQVIGVIIGGVIFQRYFVARANQSAFIDYLVQGLDELQCDTLEYWSLDVTVKNRDKARFLEARIKGAINSMTSELRCFSGRYFRKLDFGPMMVEVSEACTGGAFESAIRSADSGRHLTVVNSIHRVKWELMKRKL